MINYLFRRFYKVYQSVKRIVGNAQKYQDGWITVKRRIYKAKSIEVNDSELMEKEGK